MLSPRGVQRPTDFCSSPLDPLQPFDILLEKQGPSLVGTFLEKAYQSFVDWQDHFLVHVGECPVLFTIPSMEFAAAAALITCSDTVRPGIIVIPRSFSLTGEELVRGNSKKTVNVLC